MKFNTLAFFAFLSSVVFISLVVSKDCSECFPRVGFKASLISFSTSLTGASVREIFSMSEFAEAVL